MLPVPEPAPGHRAGPPVAGLTRPGVPARRLDERRVLRLGLALTAAFAGAAVVAYGAPVVRAGHWAGLHLSLAGAALVAVGTFMPHFGATLAGAAPESPRLRLAGIAALASGALLVVSGVVAQLSAVAVLGAVGIWLGLAVTAWNTLRPGLRPLSRRHPIAQVAYAVALAEVTIGIGLPVLLLLGWEPAVMSWARLKPAHVWLNLFGFVSLTVSATLVYLYPTILGARIRAHPTLFAMVGGGIAGPPLVALGAALDSPPVAVIGAVTTLLGAAGQLAYGVDVWRRRFRWTTDFGWHRLTTWHLTAAMGWYLAAVTGALAGIVRDGPAPAGWGLQALAIPLVAGWVLQVLAGAWTHLLPAVASTQPDVRARQRAVLGRGAVARFAAWNVGVLAAWLGLGSGSLPLAMAGVGAFASAALVAVGLVGWALLGGRSRTATP